MNDLDIINEELTDWEKQEKNKRPTGSEMENQNGNIKQEENIKAEEKMDIIKKMEAAKRFKQKMNAYPNELMNPMDVDILQAMTVEEQEMMMRYKDSLKQQVNEREEQIKRYQEKQSQKKYQEEEHQGEGMKDRMRQKLQRMKEKVQSATEKELMELEKTLKNKKPKSIISKMIHRPQPAKKQKHKNSRDIKSKIIGRRQLRNRRPRVRGELEKRAVRDFYKGKTILITGATGYIGKVILEKLLRVTEPKKIFLLMREKKKGKSHESVQERLEVISKSPVFLTLKAKLGKQAFIERFSQRVVPIIGDMLKDTIMEPNQPAYKKLKKTCDIVIHSAASIQFDEPLDYALKLNAMGSWKLMQFAKTCEKDVTFVHVSTCYVNSNQPKGSVVHEEVIPALEDRDAIEFCQHIIDGIKARKTKIDEMPEGEAKKKAKEEEKEYVRKISNSYKTQYGFPNTYTLSKNIAETILTRNHGRVKLAVVRPAIVTGTLKDPMPGWIENVSGAAAVITLLGSGMLTTLRADAEVTGDIIPADFTCNSILLAAFEMGHLHPCSYKVYHSGSSYRNSITWGQVISQAERYFTAHEPSKSLKRKSHVKLVRNHKLYATRFFLHYTLLAKAYTAFSRSVMSKKHIGIAQNLTKLDRKMGNVSTAFAHFGLTDWYFCDDNAVEIYRCLAPEEQELFFSDPSEIEWDSYLLNFYTGIQRYVFKETPKNPELFDMLKENDNNDTNVGNVRYGIFARDINYVLAKKSRFWSKKSPQEMTKIVMQSKSVRSAIRYEASSLAKTIQDTQERGYEICNRMFSSPRISYVRTAGWIMRKAWKRMYKGILVDDTEVVRLKRLLETRHQNGPIVFIPTHRSYIDFLILAFIFFAYDFPLPQIAAGEDFLSMWGFRHFFRHSGAFFVRSNFQNDGLYRAILREYIHQVLMDGCPLQFFVEGTRSRGGKTLHPKTDILSVITSAYLSKRVNNLTIIPVHIGYEKVIEGEAYQSELVSAERRFDHTLPNIRKTHNVIFNKFGDIRVKFADPIFLKDYTNDYVEMKELGLSSRVSSSNTDQSKSSRALLKKYPPFDPFSNPLHEKELVKSLAYSITSSLNKSAVIMPTAMLATALLQFRSGIGIQELSNEMVWLKNQILNRGSSVHWAEGMAASRVVEHSLEVMKGTVVKNNSLIVPHVQKLGGREDNVFMNLSCYRNQLIHVFLFEAICCLAYRAEVGHANFSPVLVRKIVKTAKDLQDLLREEYIVSDFNPEHTIQLMIDRGIFKVIDSEELLETSVYVPKEAEDARKMYFLCCSLLFPMMDTFFITAVTLCKYLLHRQAAKSFLLAYVQNQIKSGYHHHQLRYFEACSTEAINSSILALIRMKILEVVPSVSNSEPFLLLSNPLDSTQSQIVDIPPLPTKAPKPPPGHSKGWVASLKLRQPSPPKVKQAYQLDFLVTLSPEYNSFEKMVKFASHLSRYRNVPSHRNQHRLDDIAKSKL